MTGDLATPLCAAIVAILTGDATIQSLCGRTSRLVVPIDDVNDATDPTQEIPLPVLVYAYSQDTEIGGIGDQRLATVVLDAIADGNDAREIANQLAARARSALTWSAFNAAGLDAYVRAPAVRDGIAEKPEGTRGIVLMRSYLTIQALAPNA